MLYRDPYNKKKKNSILKDMHSRKGIRCQVLSKIMEDLWSGVHFAHFERSLVVENGIK